MALVDDAVADAEQREQALRCLQRYVHDTVRPKAGVGWADWYAEHRQDLVFVDSAGFWWMLDPNKVKGTATK